MIPGGLAKRTGVILTPVRILTGSEVGLKTSGHESFLSAEVSLAKVSKKKKEFEKVIVKTV
jgi:hypothetical protein